MGFFLFLSFLSRNPANILAQSRTRSHVSDNSQSVPCTLVHGTTSLGYFDK